MVETVQRQSAWSWCSCIVAPLLGPLGTAALVLLLVIFMLLQREDLRSRLIRLIGQGRISATTRAMDDAGARVSRYLLMQLIVNVTYGIPVAVGLYFIGVPNAVLWGAFAIVLRFIPYIGPWIAAILPDRAFPRRLAAAGSCRCSPSRSSSVLELLSNNVMEPWLYGSQHRRFVDRADRRGRLLDMALGAGRAGARDAAHRLPRGHGRHVPRLSFLSVVLSDEEALTPAEDCYHRLLTLGEQDEWNWWSPI